MKEWTVQGGRDVLSRDVFVGVKRWGLGWLFTMTFIVVPGPDNYRPERVIEVVSGTETRRSK